MLSSINVVEENEVGGGGSNGIKSRIVSKKSTRVDYLNFEGIIGAKGFGYLIPNIKKTFNHLQHAFTKALIFQHFDPERHIWVEIDTSGHAISRVPSQLTLDDLGQ